MAIEGPSKAEISCVDNKDGTCSVSYLPTLPGDYNILVKYNADHIPGSPFTARIRGRLLPINNPKLFTCLFVLWEEKKLLNYNEIQGFVTI